MKNAKVDEKLARIRATAATSVSLAGGVFQLLPSVYPSTELTELIVSCFDDADIGIEPGDKLLDYGTGCGYLAVQAAKRGALVVAIDINERAVQCARQNSTIHGVAISVDARVSDCFSALKYGERFDWIVSGLPWDDYQPEDMLAYAMYDPGWRMRSELFRQCTDRLTEKGRLLLTYSESAEARRPLLNGEPSVRFEVIRAQKIKGEMHFVYLGRPTEKATTNECRTIPCT